MPYAAKSFPVELLSEENVKKNVLPYYGLENGSIEQVKIKDTDKQRAVYKIIYFNKSYCLKKIYYSLEELLFVYSSIEWYYRNEIRVPRILPTIDRGRFVNYNNMLFILTPWIEGEKCNYDNIDHVFNAITNLAVMHKCSHNFKPIKGSTIRENYDNPHISDSKHLKQILDCSNLAFKYKDKFSKLYLQNFDCNLLLAKTSTAISSSIDADNLTRALCHLDYVNKNIIFDDDKNIWVIDFDKCRMDFCAHDISYFLRRLLKRNSTLWDFEITINCLNLYEEINPLTLDDYKYILSYLAFPQKYWKISRDYYNNIKKCNQTSFVLLLKKAVEKDTEQLEFILKLGRYVENKFGIKIY